MLKLVDEAAGPPQETNYTELRKKRIVALLKELRGYVTVRVIAASSSQGWVQPRWEPMASMIGMARSCSHMKR
ncbi:MAG: hypothetical protein IPL64_04350 [Flavobacteriales bacterium]|nr:hypothetical protein [Flavobacteriales bacterium]